MQSSENRRQRYVRGTCCSVTKIRCDFEDDRRLTRNTVSQLCVMSQPRVAHTCVYFFPSLQKD